MRDSMLKKPITGEDNPPQRDSSDSPHKDLQPVYPSTPPSVDEPGPPHIRRDETIDFKSDEEKRMEIERILSSSSTSPNSPRDGLTRRFSPPPPSPPPPPARLLIDSDLAPFRPPSSSWSSIFPRRFWNGWFSGSGRDHSDDDNDERLGRHESESSPLRSGWSGSSGGFSTSFSSSFTSTSTSRTVRPDGTEETKKTVRDGNGVTETTTRRKGGRNGSITRIVDKNGEETE